MFQTVIKFFADCHSFFTRSPKDELIGRWENEDDGTGLHAIWGYGIEFLEDGNGYNYQWGSDINPEDRKEAINWRREGDKKISLKFETDTKWITIEYEISRFVGSYNSRYYKITELSTNQFWCSPEPLYKIKR